MSHYAVFDESGSMLEINPQKTNDSYELSPIITDELFSGVSNVADYRIFKTDRGPFIARSFMEILFESRKIFLPKDNYDGDAITFTIFPKRKKVRVSIPRSEVTGKPSSLVVTSFKIHITSPDFEIAYGSYEVDCRELVVYGDFEFSADLGNATNYAIMTDGVFPWYRMEVDTSVEKELQSSRGFILSNGSTTPSVVVTKKGDVVRLDLVEDDIDLSMHSFVNIMLTMKGDYSIAYGSLAVDLEQLKMNKYFEAVVPGLPDSFGILCSNFTRNISVHENEIPFNSI